MISVAGGFYREICREPKRYDETYGSGGRAAAIIGSIAEGVKFYTYANDEGKDYANYSAELFKYDLNITDSSEFISFTYTHCLSSPNVYPQRELIGPQNPLNVSADAVLRFGFMEGDAIVHGEKVVYDPQTQINTPRFEANGSTADSLIIVANSEEIQSLSNDKNSIEGANKLVEETDVEGVVVKRGPFGVYATTKNESAHLPAFKTERVGSIGSGDMFSAAFAYHWASKKLSVFEAAHKASQATAYYCQTQFMKIPNDDDISQFDFPPLPTNVDIQRKSVYLAGPFFDISQRWLIGESKRCLEAFGINVFSPYHFVGFGKPEQVYPKDIAGLKESDCVFAILNGLDPGTIYEIGFAISIGKPVIALTQEVPKKDLTMIVGGNCVVKNDFVSAVYETVWQLLEA